MGTIAELQGPSFPLEIEWARLLPLGLWRRRSPFHSLFAIRTSPFPDGQSPPYVSRSLPLGLGGGPRRRCWASAIRRPTPYDGTRVSPPTGGGQGDM